MPAANAKTQRIGPGRLSAEQTAELPDRLLDAAFFLFTEHGYADATMDQIAKRAGASTKTLYARFSNKSEILEAVIRRNVERAIAEHVRAFAMQPQGVAPREFLLKLGLQVAGAQDDETTGLARLSLAEAHRFPVLRKMYREVTGRGIDAIASALHVWRDDGLIEFDADADLLASICFGMMTDTPRVRAVIGDPLSRAEMQRYVTTGVDLFLDGLVAKAPKKRGKK